MGTKQIMPHGFIRLFKDFNLRQAPDDVKNPYTVNHWKEIEQSDSSPPVI